jgi:hypothetical protein
MEDFKSNPKMQCFREGGQVKYESRKEHAEEMKSDTAQDKKVVKKAFSIHDTQQHEAKTDLSKLNRGGRAKKNKGTVKKFKSGGEVTNVYEAKKASGDKDNIRKVKDIKAVKLCGGKSVKKMADGGATMDPNNIGGGVLNAIGSIPGVGGALQSGATTLRNNVMGTPEQNRIAREREQMIARKKAMAAAAMQGAGAGGLSSAAQQSDLAQGLPAAAPAPAPMPAPMPLGRKKGGKACK